MEKDNERGAVIIEATLSLTFFLFAILTLYSMFHVCLAQARISAALNSSAKEISQYTYLYELTGANQKQANLAANGGQAATVMSDNFSEINNLYDALSGIGNGISSIVSSSDNAESFAYYALNQGVEGLKAAVAGEIAELLMKKHFGSNPDKFLGRLGIEGGMSNLDFSKSRLFTDGEDADIQLNVQYEVTVVKLLDIDMKMKFELCAKTRAWVGS